MGSVEDDIVGLMPLLRRYALSLSRNRQDADDLLQDCMEAAIAHSRSWRGRNLKGWLMTIMTNLDRGRHRKAHGLPQFRPVEDAEEVAAPFTDAYERQRLLAAINGLPPDHRSVLMLVVVEGCAYSEAAEILAVPLGTVMSRLSRARRALADNLRGGNVVDLRRPS